VSARVKLLDHGYLELVEAWGSDERIIESARMSTGNGFLGWGPYCTCKKCGGKAKKVPDTQGWDGSCENCGMIAQSDVLDTQQAGDEKLLKYLYDNKHATPFEFGGLVIEVQAPIFVFREWHRHRTQSYNEMSARYTPLPDLNYVPTVERLMMNSKTNKQAGTAAGAVELTVESAELYRRALAMQYESDQRFYEEALAAGVPKELARIHLPVGRYSKMRASTCLRNWLAFLTLRMAPTAQWEIREYANAVGSLVQQNFPRTWDLFVGAGR
jgi:thymidylate synthase (FAD)